MLVKFSIYKGEWLFRKYTALIYTQELDNSLLERTMTRIEECEKLLSDWKAARDSCMDNEEYKRANEIDLRMIGAEAAIAIIKRPSNTQMHTDACVAEQDCKSCPLEDDPTCENYLCD